MRSQHGRGHWRLTPVRDGWSALPKDPGPNYHLLHSPLMKCETGTDDHMMLYLASELLSLLGRRGDLAITKDTPRTLHGNKTSTTEGREERLRPEATHRHDDHAELAFCHSQRPISTAVCMRLKSHSTKQRTGTPSTTSPSRLYISTVHAFPERSGVNSHRDLVHLRSPQLGEFVRRSKQDEAQAGVIAFVAYSGTSQVVHCLDDNTA